MGLRIPRRVDFLKLAETALGQRLIFQGMKRSGNHAVINWMLGGGRFVTQIDGIQGKSASEPSAATAALNVHRLRRPWAYPALSFSAYVILSGQSKQKELNHLACRGWWRHRPFHQFPARQIYLRNHPRVGWATYAAGR